MARYSIKKCRCQGRETIFGVVPCSMWVVYDERGPVSEWPSWRDAFRAVQQRQARDAFVHPARRNWQLPQTKRWSGG